MHRPTKMIDGVTAGKLDLLKSLINQHHLSVVKQGSWSYIKDDNGFLNFYEDKKYGKFHRAFYTEEEPLVMGALMLFDDCNIDKLINDIEMFYKYLPRCVKVDEVLGMFNTEGDAEK